MSLDGVRMYVSSTGDRGVVGAETTLRFVQKGSAVFARYSGGNVDRGCLVGRLAGSELAFRYAQREVSGDVHGGRSRCEVTRLTDGRLRIVEHFSWETRVGSGTNVFDEIPDEGVSPHSTSDPTA
jgi:hypothetical protein